MDCVTGFTVAVRAAAEGGHQGLVRRFTAQEVQGSQRRRERDERLGRRHPRRPPAPELRERLSWGENRGINKKQKKRERRTENKSVWDVFFFCFFRTRERSSTSPGRWSVVASFLVEGRGEAAGSAEG